MARIWDGIPTFIPPMLCVSGEPFDSDDFSFEIKWDGTRVIAVIGDGSHHLFNRRRVDLTDRYPEFAALRGLPGGTILDGELVMLRDGKPDFQLLMSREHARSPLKITSMSKSMPATFVVFDILFDCGESVMHRPFQERRALLTKWLSIWNLQRVVLSKSVTGRGMEFFRLVTAEGLEGVVAKKLTSEYLPGERSESWIKIKRKLDLVCLVIGFLPEGTDDFRSLILAIEEGGELQSVGKVGTGFTDKMRAKVNQWLWSHLCKTPVIPSREKGKWVEPRLLCRVSCMERTPNGELRMPVFMGLIER